MIIYNTDDTELLNAIITEGAEHEEELMKSDFIKLSFSADVRMTLPVGAYIVFNGLKYRLSEPYQPSQESEIEFKYEPLFHHPKMWLGKVIFVFDTTDTTGKSIKQQVWDYNGFTGTLLQYVVDAINEAFGFAEEDKFNYTVIGEVDNTVSVSFSNTDILSAISAIASACKDNQCEWHLDWNDKSLYFGQLAYNRGEEKPILKVGENVGKASVSTSNDGYYNVFRPEGSTRNMSIKAASGENVSTGIRLGLNETDYPDGKIYVSPSGDIITKAAFEASGVPAQTLGLSFDDVYPHVDLYAYNIRKRTRYLLDDSGKKVVDHYDGENPIYKTYTVWYMRLAYPTIVGGSVTGWTDYTLDVDKQVLDGYKPMITFKANTSEGALSSSLAGQPTSGDGFEIVYHKADDINTILDDESTVKAGDYEIVFVKQGDNDMIVPTNEDAGLIPRGEATPSLNGNIVVLYNIAMGANEVLAAQQDLLNETKKEITRRFSDLNNYTVQSYPHVFEKANPNLYVGQRVVFNNGGYQLTTRVTKLVTKLDYDFIQTITVGNQQIKGSISQLKEDVKTIMSGNFSGAGINQTQALNLIKNYVGSRFLSKLSPDTAQGVITFLKGLKLGDGTHGIDAEGVARLKELFLDKAYIDAKGEAVVGSVKSADYRPGLLDGSGFGMYKDGLDTVAEVDKLNVRKKAVFAKLDVREFAFTSGDVGYTSAGCKIDKVTQQLDSGNYRCYWLAEQDGVKIENAWHVGDQAMCRTSNIINKETSMAANRYYWRLVVGKGEEKTIDGKVYHYIDLSNTDGSLTLTIDGKDYPRCVGYDTLVVNDEPQAEDSLVQLGSQTDKDRQYAYIIYVSTGERVDYNGINDFDLSSHITTKMGVHGTTVHSDYFEILGPTGVSTSLVTERGAWVDGTTAYHYDHFSYNNATWLCIVGKGQSTTEAPNEESGMWIKETYGMKGDDGSSSYTYLRYSNDGGQTFTAASQAAIDAAKGSLPLDGRNLIDMSTLIPNEGSQPFTSVNAATNTFSTTVALVDGHFGIGLPPLSIFASHSSYTLSGYIKSSIAVTLGVDINVTAAGDKSIVLAANTSTYFSVAFSGVALTATDGLGLYFTPQGGEDGFTVTFDKLKLEVGDKASAWSPTNLVDIENAYRNSWDGRNLVQGVADESQVFSFTGAPDKSYDLAAMLRMPPDRKVGDKFILSAEAKLEAEDVTKAWILIGAGTAISDSGADSKWNGIPGCGVPTSLAGKGWSKVSRIFEITSGNVIYATKQFKIQAGWLTGTLQVKNIQLKRGDSETTWTPAPEDCTFGTTEGEYMGTLVWDKPYPSNDPKDYTWGKVKGNDGKGIASVTEKYQVSSSATTAPTSWSNTPPATTATNRYLWNYEQITYTDGTSTDTQKRVIGVYGDTGKDAVTVRLVPDKIVVDTGDDGMVPDTALENVEAKVEVWRGNSLYFGTASLKNTSEGIGASVSGTVTDGYTVKIESIGKDPSTVTDGDQDSGYAYAQGWVDVNVNVDGVAHTVRLTVETNIHKVVAKLNRTADSIGLSVTSLEQDVDGYKEETDAKITAAEGRITDNVTKVDDLGTRMSNVEQTADSISLKVSETVLKGNLLAGTMFRRESEVTWNDPAYKGVISTAVQYRETNSVYLESTYTSTTNKGIKWLKIPVTGSKTYSLSFWYRTPDTSANGNFTVMVNAYKADGTSAEASNPINVTALPITDNNVWQLYKGSMTLGSDVAAVDVMIYLATKGKMYVARPMLIEGSYVGWQRSEQDYDYIGGNLLDETKTLTKRGNLTHVDGTVTGNAFGWCSAIYAQGASPYTEILQWLIPYDLNADYTLSFMAKGTGHIQTHIYSSAGAADVALFTETECETYDVGVWGSSNYTLTPDWKRRTVRWRTKGTRTQANALVVIRVDQSSEAYISQPKLEKGCVATEWTDGDGDMVSTKALLATGIDIENRKVTITSDNVQVQNNSGDTTMLLDRDGKLNVDVLDASKVKAGSVSCTDSQSGTMMTIANGFFSALNGKAGVKLGLDANNVPCLMGVDADGNIIWTLGRDYHIGTLDNSVSINITSESGLCKASGKQWGRGVRLVLTVTNGSTSAITIDKNSFQLIVSDDYGTYYTNYPDTPTPVEIAVGGSATWNVKASVIEEYDTAVDVNKGVGASFTYSLYYYNNKRSTSGGTYSGGGSFANGKFYV